MEQFYSLKEIISNTEKRLSIIKENKENLDSKLTELNELKKMSYEYFNFQKNILFKNILKKYKSKKQVIEFMNSIFDKIEIDIYDLKVDLNNIDFTIFDNKINNIKKDIGFYNSEKKIKLKELEMVKQYISGLSIYKQFKRDFSSSVFDQHYTNNRNKILKNIGNVNFVKQYINDKYYKLKFSRCLLKDEFRYKEYEKEKESIKCSLIDLELIIIEKQNLLNDLICAKEKLMNLKDENFFIKELNSFFIKNFDIKHNQLINNKNFNKYYFNYKTICLILNNLKNELILLEEFYNKKWEFFKKIRCFKYTQKYKSFKFKKEEIELEISEYINNLYEQYKIFKKIITINLENINNININNENDFLLFLNDKFGFEIYNNFNIKDDKNIEVSTIFKNNIMQFEYINL